MSKTNFLIGRGELLTSKIPPPGGGGAKVEVYSLEEARARLGPQIVQMASAVATLPKEACPHDFAVARLVLNPGYIAKSYFPAAMLHATGLSSVGSRTVQLTPKKWTRSGTPKECPTTELFVAGKRSAFQKLPQWMAAVAPGSSEALDLAHIEAVSNFSSADRVKAYSSGKDHVFEVILHMLPGVNSAFINTEFEKYAKHLGATAHMDLALDAGTLRFIPVEIAKDNVAELSAFSFVRVVRPMPKLRGLRPASRSSEVSVGCTLPTDQPLSSEPKVAILDGGLPDQHPINLWLRPYVKLDASAQDDPDGLIHGLAVTSAFLFGPITPRSNAPRPFSYVHHLRVLDKKSDAEDPFELYRTLGFVEQVLRSRSYEFINLSLGPRLPIEDTDVHAWTSVIDDLLSDGNTFMTVAVGNDGEMDWKSGNARVQVPSDCVNAIAVGATNRTEDSWLRAPYSSIGPGRSPGVVKPDLMAFGGDVDQFFYTLAAGVKPTLIPQLGTSFASPYLLRNAVGIRAILGAELSPLAIKALLVHGAENPSDHAQAEVGWGKMPEDLQTIITCPPGVARIVYQGDLEPGKYLRAKLPLPVSGLTGKIRLKATFCYASPTDPQDASAYTRAGLGITFRPNDKKFAPAEAGAKKKTNAKTKSFFEKKIFATEEYSRSDMGKWETVLHGDHGMFGKSLDGSVFDIHYNAREGAGKATGPEKIRYALVITVEAPKHANLYNDILQAHTLLVPIEPKISLPIRV